MRPTADDYWRVADAFASSLASLGDDLSSIVVWGSLARGDLVPGKSDVLDAYVVLADGVLSDQRAHARCVLRLVEACRGLRESGLPYSHPVHYQTTGELADQDALYLPTMVAVDSSHLLAGEDPRPRLAAQQGAQAVARCVFFAMSRRFLSPLAAYLTQPQLTDAELRALLARLLRLLKALPTFACAALGEPTTEGGALSSLRRLAPHIDLAVFDELCELRRGESALRDGRQAQALLRRCFQVAVGLEELACAAGAGIWEELVLAPVGGAAPAAASSCSNEVTLSAATKPVAAARPSRAISA